MTSPFTLVIESFTASPITITKGQSATLSWGFVKGAERDQPVSWHHEHQIKRVE